MSRAIFLLLGIFLILCTESIADEIAAIPYGAKILPNGFMGEKEWDNSGAVCLESDDNISICLSQDSHYVYIGIYSTDTQHTGIDLYLKTEQSCKIRLHISSAHARSECCDTIWSEMDYCENRLWTSNLVESIFADGKTQYIAPEIFEYQIDKSLIPGRLLNMMIHLKRPKKIVPSGAARDDSGGWLRFRL